MKMNKLMVSICAASLLFAGTAMADPPGHAGHGHGHGNPHAWKHHGYERMHHDRGRKEGWYHKGGRVPEMYRSQRYVVTDWRAYHLHEPPRGYRWQRSDNGDFLLVAMTTGVILNIIANQ
ncbi:RcnB family protein [Oleiagrimonas soli]|uniref:Ni/Co efflux regulator RcnB n=1 Tax=Oleiagrimonas soli TaxID=1543381 RepID=A0A099CW53_9GAMM|nr:RcnB family protein [Oleiagrimonas soli]KGI78193.1 hypothetical protein LF63_0107600 [Oleiagrimonas soli]MBB6183350.1 Ni/Co efflux regulator RcnB [Oleiagrimonas soli]